MTADLPPSPGTTTGDKSHTPRSELDPDMATMKMAERLAEQLGRPSDVSKIFVVRKAIFQSITHTKSNSTGYDATLRIALYDAVEKGSVNVNGKWFNAFTAFLMKPKYIIQGMPLGQSSFENKEPGFFQRLLGWGKKDNTQQPQQGGTS